MEDILKTFVGMEKDQQPFVQVATNVVLGQIPSVQKVLDPILCEQGTMGRDLHTQESVASCTAKEGDSLDSTCEIDLILLSVGEQI